MSTSASSNRTGSCLCKAIQYEITGDPVVTNLCHCLNCQKWSGSAFTSFGAYPKTVSCVFLRLIDIFMISMFRSFPGRESYSNCTILERQDHQRRVLSQNLRRQGDHTRFGHETTVLLQLRHFNLCGEFSQPRWNGGRYRHHGQQGRVGLGPSERNFLQQAGTLATYHRRDVQE